MISDIWQIATVFLSRKFCSSRQLLLLQRSAEVSTFKRKWAAISGSIEKGELPEAAAWREVFEETGISRDQAKLIRSGLPLNIEIPLSETRHDGLKVKKFRIHPFLLDIALDTDINLDWEHTSKKWLFLENVKELQKADETVPNLYETLLRVWDPVRHPSFLQTELLQESAIELFNNRSSGASELALEAVRLVRLGADPDAVAALRPSMVILGNAAHAAANKDEEFDVDLAIRSSQLRAAKNLSSVLRKGVKEVITFSRSSTVLKALTLLPPGHLRVIASESLPGGEGNVFAEECTKHGHSVTLLSDEDLLLYMSQKKCAGNFSKTNPLNLDTLPERVILVGADAILSDGAIVNKIGTKNVAEVGLQNGIPLVVVSDKWKAWNDFFAPPLESIFEVVSKELVAHLVTD